MRARSLSQPELPPAPDLGDGDPVLLAGEWLAPDTLRLSFSQPLAPTSDLAVERFTLSSWRAVSAYDTERDLCRSITFYGQEIEFVAVVAALATDQSCVV